MALATRFTELAGCRVPMGSMSTSALAVAVADAGGVGSIAALGLTAAELDKVLACMAARTTGVTRRELPDRRHRPGGRSGRCGACTDRRLLLGRP